MNELSVRVQVLRNIVQPTSPSRANAQGVGSTQGQPKECGLGQRALAAHWGWGEAYGEEAVAISTKS